MLYFNDTELDEQEHVWMLSYSCGAVIPALVNPFYYNTKMIFKTISSRYNTKVFNSTHILT